MVNSELSHERRPIVSEFEKLITEHRRDTKKTTSIKFRNEQNESITRTRWKIPIRFLRFRKDNGRIATEVMSYEAKKGEVLKEGTDQGQEIIRSFLENKNPDAIGLLMSLLRKDGQQETAIATRDGFLINGNRRKLAFMRLSEEFSDEDAYKYMEVVLLPGSQPEPPDSGPSPTNLEIEQIENRYQLQSEGKEEYTEFDKALSIRRKIEYGMSLDEQLKDDAKFKYLQAKEFKKKVKEYEDEFLGPLECIDRYLEHFQEEGEYSLISSGPGDPEGRWQAFKDYYSYMYKKLQDERGRSRAGIEENDISNIECTAFNIIRRREIPNIKLHQVMRDMLKWMEHPSAKEELLKISEIPNALETVTKEVEDISAKQREKKWAHVHGATIVNSVKKAFHFHEFKEEQENTLSLLEGALKKLNHKNLDPKSVLHDANKCIELLRNIQVRAEEIEEQFDHLRQLLKKK